MKRSNWWMYFVQGQHSQNVKIGIATCPYRRINAIQASCSEKLAILGIARIISGNSEEDARDAEAIIHQHFAGQRLHGEFFSPSSALLRLARANRAEKHQCHRCATIIIPGDSLAISESIKPIRSSKASKERHANNRLARHPKGSVSLYHRKLPRTFFPRRDQDEYGGKVHHLREGVSITDYSLRVSRYNPSLG